MDLKKVIIILVAGFFSLGAGAQVISSQYLIFFKVYKVQNHMDIQWRTGANFTCADVNLYFGTDSTQMREIYSYPGVCGGPSTEIDYNWLHENPDKGTIYYQLRLGTYGNSQIISVINPKLSNGYLVYPNPISDVGTIQIENTKLQKYEFSFYDIQGRELAYSVSTETSTLEVSKADLAISGMVIFQAKNLATGAIIRGKFSVL